MSILVLTSDTLIGTPATGNLEYNGQFYGTDSNNARAQIQRITQGTAVASTSGTSITFSSIPSWVKRITVMFQGVSTSGTSTPLVQIGSGSVTSSGYLGAGTTTSTTSTAGTNFTTGFGIQSAAAANVIHGIMLINLVDSATYKYTASFSGGLSNSVNNLVSGGSVTLGGLLDRVVITTANGTDTFDAGSVNILYEG